MSTSNGHHNGQASDEAIDTLYAWFPPQPASQPLPEAPASVNFRAMLRGFEVQITLRDQAESALLVRLDALLKRQDLRPIPKPAPKTGTWKGRQYQGR
jgi:hypothetical protein